MEVAMDPLGQHDPFDAPPTRLSDHLDDLVVWFERKRHLLPRTLIALLAVGLVAAGGAWWMDRSRTPTSIEDRIPMVALEPTVPGDAPPGEVSPGGLVGTNSADGTVGEADPGGSGLGGTDNAMAGSSVTVHVAGAVANPGVFVLGGDDRVIDAVEAAGGALAGADLSVVNLAAPLIDGSQIRIPLVGETIVAPLLPMGGSQPGGPGAEADAGTPVDLNRATGAELETLTGVGPATAEAILTWRTNNGPFVTAEQLLDVPGIGPAKFAAMADQVVVG